MKKRLLWACLALGFAQSASAQVPYDPPTSVKAAPNVFLILDANRTTLISGAACGAPCHYEGFPDGDSGQSKTLYMQGLTRLSLARRVLTGGWGWNTAAFHGPSGGSADGKQRPDGIMDQYKVRWGVMWYDGLGARWVLNPTFDGPNKVAQKAVIDFGRPGFGENWGPVGFKITEQGGLNSFLPYLRTLNYASFTGPLSSDAWGGLPWHDYGDTHLSGARQARSLKMIRDYLHDAADVQQFQAPDASSAVYFDPMGTAESPTNFASIYGDVANVLNSPVPAGCRRNFTIMLLDGHGGGPIPSAGDLNFYGPTDAGDQGKMPATIAAEVYNMGRNHAAPAAGPQIVEANLRNQVFAIHFGSEDLANADKIADAGFDGVIDGIPKAFDAAPGGALTNLSGLYAAFASIFQLILDGTYLGSAPTITNSGDVRVVSKFDIQNCNSALPNQCNIGRIGHLERDVDVNKNGKFDDAAANLDFSAVLRSRKWTNRRIYTSYNTTATNCSVFGSCPVVQRTATLSAISGASFPGNGTLAGISGNDYQFMAGDPTAQFANTVARGDTRNNSLAYFGTGGAPVPLTNPFKLMDIANSRSVVVSAPTGIGEDITRWDHFRQMLKKRYNLNGGNDVNAAVKVRDEVVYIGGNDGMVHAFLSRRHNPVGLPPPGRTTNYDTALGNCPVDLATPIGSQVVQSNCLGIELWGYSPQLLHNYWGAIRGGHYFMVDGSPIVSDVLFTKGNNNPPVPALGTACTLDGSAACVPQWEYRTVLIQCLGGGGPGCFALDVSNPYDPKLLWERQMTTASTVRQTTSSRPQIVRMRRMVGGIGIPYSVALMGGGLGETKAGVPAGSFLAVGLEDGTVTYSPTQASGPFAGSPTCLDTDNDSFTDTCYISTVDAQIYKVRFANGDPASMSMALFFDGRARLGVLGLPGSTTIRSYSRIAVTFDSNRDLRLFYGTGNFEDVQNATESNYFFELRDGDPSAAPGLTAINGSSCGGGTGVNVLGPREKIIFDPIISNGTVLFTSYAPDPNPCLTGPGFLYGVSYDKCTAALDDGVVITPLVSKITLPSPGMPSQPVVNDRSGAVTVGLDNGTVIENAAIITLVRQLSINKLWWRIVR